MIVTERLRLATGPGMRIHDITEATEELLAACGLRHGTATLFAPGATAAITTIEYEPGLVGDLEALFDGIAPAGASYQHDRAWHDGNGHAHVRASLLGPSLSVPFEKGRLLLGTWQQVIFVDFDPPARTREVIVQFMGE